MFLLSFFMIIPSNAESLHSAVDGFFLPCIFLNIFRGSLSVFSARGRRRKERRKKENWWVLRCGESCRRLRPNECLHNLGGPMELLCPQGFLLLLLLLFQKEYVISNHSFFSGFQLQASCPFILDSLFVAR